MLWQGTGAASHVKILGSLHVLSGAPPEWALAPIRTSDRVVMEARPPTPEEMERPGGITITESWPELRNAFDRATRLVNISVEQLNRTWPGWAALVLSFRAVGDLVDQGIEAVISRILEERGIEPSFLETVEDFRTLFSQILPLEEQVRFLWFTMGELAHARSRVLRAEADWRNGRLEALAEKLKMVSPPPEAREVFRAIFQERNREWMPRLETYIQESARIGERLLVIVGVGHLWGPANILSLLNDRNLAFEQVMEA